MRWEYCAIDESTTWDYDDDRLPTLELYVKYTLEERGDLGWEAFSVTYGEKHNTGCSPMLTTLWLKAVMKRAAVE